MQIFCARIDNFRCIKIDAKFLTFKNNKTKTISNRIEYKNEKPKDKPSSIVNCSRYIYSKARNGRVRNYE